jgi:large subunit ribosomal protein L18
MKRLIAKQNRRIKRRRRIRGKVSGTAERPRISVFRSNKNIYAQAIDDASGTTLAAVSSLSADFKSASNNSESASKIGEELGKKLVAMNVSTAVFDRGGYLYHGVVKSLADGARKAGLTF